MALTGWKTYLAAFGMAATALTKYFGHDIDLVGLFQQLSAALAVAGFRDVIGRLLGK